MGLKTSNNVSKVIALAVGTGDTEITLADVVGLPDVTAGGDYTILTLIRLSDGLQEIVQVDDIVGNVLTVVRAQEGTTALAFSASDQARNFFTSGMFDQFVIDKAAVEASEAKAQDWAEEAEDVEVETGQYSAFHWAQKAIAEGGSGGILGQGTDTEKTGDYTILAADITAKEPLVLTSAAVANSVFTLDVSLLADNTVKLNILNKSAYRLELIVSNTGTMTINGLGTNRYRWLGDSMLTLVGDTATNVNIIAGG
jgi:hypothetical protein